MLWLIINGEKDSHKLLRNPKVTFLSHAWSGILNKNSNKRNKHYWRREREDKKKIKKKIIIIRIIVIAVILQKITASFSFRC